MKNLATRTVYTELYQADCRDWLKQREPSSIHAVITDPPYGMLEYSEEHLEKLRAGKGGVWRIPPEIGGSKRQPLPRFTVLTRSHTKQMSEFFEEWGRLLLRVLVPGAHDEEEERGRRDDGREVTYTPNEKV